MENSEYLLSSSFGEGKGYGFAELENRVEATERTVYRLGSVTKQFTAIAIMMLVEQGKIHLDDDLTKYAPDYPTQGHKITIDRLLNHTSGIMGYTEMGEKFWGKSRLDLSHEEMIDLFSAEPFEFVHGTRRPRNERRSSPVESTGTESHA